MAVQHKGLHLLEKELACNKRGWKFYLLAGQDVLPPSRAQMDLIRLPSPPSGVPS